MEAKVVKASKRVLRRSEIPDPERFQIYPKVRNVILAALRPNDTDEPEKYRPGSFISDAARHAGIPPDVLKSWIQHGEQYPNGPLGKFSKEVYKIIAERNDMKQAAMWELAYRKKDWQPIARLGEQDDPDTWTRPKENVGNTTNIIDKLMIVHNANGNQLTTGD